MSTTQERYFKCSLILIVIFCIANVSCQNFLNISGDMVSLNIITPSLQLNLLFNYKLSFLLSNKQKKCLKLKQKYPALNCAEVLTNDYFFYKHLENNIGLNSSFANGDESISANKTCNISEPIEMLYYKTNSTATINSDSHRGEYAMNKNMLKNPSNSKLSEKVDNKEMLEVHFSNVDGKINYTNTTEQVNEKGRIRVHLNETESSPLLSVKSSDDLKLSIDLNNSGPNETMGSEEFLSKMMDISKKSNLKLQVN